MPRCLGWSGSVRVNRMPQSLYWAPEVHTFWPFTTHSSPSRTAVVRSPPRSEPATGSENSWHHTSSPLSMAGRKRSFWASVPWAMMVGPAMPMPTANTPVAATRLASSSLKMPSWMPPRPRPPYSTGQVIEPQPPSYLVRCHALHRAT